MLLSHVKDRGTEPQTCDPAQVTRPGSGAARIKPKQPKPSLLNVPPTQLPPTHVTWGSSRAGGRCCPLSNMLGTWTECPPGARHRRSSANGAVFSGSVGLQSP